MAKSMFSIKIDVKKYTKQMVQLNKEMLPKAIVGTVNAVGMAAHKQSIKNVKSMFTIRTAYTEKSIRFQPSKYKQGRSIDRINAISGSYSKYMKLQEEGAVIRAKKKRMPIPTLFSRGGSRRNLIQKEYKMRSMGQVAGFKQQYTKKGNRKRGKGFFFLPGRGGLKPGIYIRKGGRLRMVRDLSRKRYSLKPTYWHSKAVKKFYTKRLMGQVFIREAKKQLGKIK